MLGAVAGPAPTLGAPDDGTEGAADVVCGAPVLTTGFARVLARFVDTVMAGRVWAFGAPATIAGRSGMGTTFASERASAGAGDWAGALSGNIGINATASANRRHSLDTSPPYVRADTIVRPG